jgi:hypothetical protein
VLSARSPRPRVARACLAGLAVALTATGCSLFAGSGAHPSASQASTAGKGAGQATTSPASGLPAAVTRPMAGPAGRGPVPVPAVSVLAGGTPSSVSARFSQQLFVSSPVVVVAAATSADPGSLRAASSAAGRAHAPLLLAPPGQAQPSPAAAGPTAARTATSATTPASHATSASQAAAVNAGLIAAIKRLAPQVVLVAGLPAAPFARQLGADVSVVTSVSRLPQTSAPAPLRGLAVLVPPPGSGPSPVVTAVTVTARDAGAAVIPVPGGDPRADPPVIVALARQRPRQVIGVGQQFGGAVALRERVSMAVTGVQLPGGGQVVFPGRRLVALYGHPGTPALGVLGQQDLAASVARARQTAAKYVPLSDGLPVVPAFEIIATVAEASPGPDKAYSAVTPVADIEPWVRQASAAGMYVVLDLQPGRASLLAQAQQYAPLLRLPNVGLALDAEWKLQPAQLPLKQIGHVDVSEVNAVISWLATLTDTYRLPQKLLVLHQFQLQMIRDEARLDTTHDDLAIVVHMDGQGTPSMKQATWRAVVAALPHGVFLGWKDFLVKDHPMLTPAQTMTETPTPVMISYQ